VDLVARRRDGRLIPLLVSASPILTKTGELAGATMILVDVSTLKDLERLREEWISIIVHDLQQPINTIVLRTDPAFGSGGGDIRSEAALHIRAAAKHLSRMVSDLLDASQLETHRMHVRTTRVDLTKLVHEVVERIPEAVARTEISISMHGPPFVLADPQRLEQVVTNLVSNALKYAFPDSNISIDVDQIGLFAKVSVANRGPVVPADEIPLLFERYVRARTARMSGTRGLGLGLYIAKRLVEAQGGRIWVESGPGPVTTFHFTIPLDASQRHADGSPASAVRIPRPESLEVQP
jgi:signal transduction histidine kinase